MKITYIYHSSFLIETEGLYMLFDYFKGSLPSIKKNKPLYVFSSHSHMDHFDKCVFDLFKEHNVKYILSRDIYKKYKIEADNITYVYPNREYVIDNIKITTLKSTDLGVAFLISCGNKTIFHSGDLHYWVWQEESKEYNNNMKANYIREIDKLKGIDIDTAFIPLDPRQGEWYDKGMNYILENINVKNIFPMHMWEKYDIIDKLANKSKNTKIFKINKELGSWEV